MNRYVALIVLIAAAGCNKPATNGSKAPHSAAPAISVPTYASPPRRKEADAYFAKWLESHGHSNVVVDAEGVGIEGNATRLKASLYGSKQHAKGGFIIELEFTVQLPSNHRITEFVAGIGDTEEKAINDAMVNFTLTTFHVLYKGFINADDPHINSTPIEMPGGKRDLIMGDILMRGGQPDQKTDLNFMRAEIQGALKKLTLSGEPHWIKIVYSQDGGKPVTVAVTLDNLEHRELTDAVTQLPWPRTGAFYMANQFIVIK